MVYDDDDLMRDEAYFDSGRRERAFDTRLLREPTSVIAVRKPLVFAREDTVTDAMRGMQGEHRGAVLVTEDGTPATPVIGIFTERDVLFRIVDGGRNPATLALREVMTPEPECVHEDDSIAATLNMMSVGGFRHVPVVDEKDCPAYIISVKDVVQFLVDSFPREILNLGSDHTRQREGG